MKQTFEQIIHDIKKDGNLDAEQLVKELDKRYYKGVRLKSLSDWICVYFLEDTDLTFDEWADDFAPYEYEYGSNYFC